MTRNVCRNDPEMGRDDSESELKSHFKYHFPGRPASERGQAQEVFFFSFFLFFFFYSVFISRKMQSFKIVSMVTQSLKTCR